ncbi:HEPN domain-containing protein [Candidatus Bathyarchaeota archaeon]|nr:HEPN domain-containing protein [Candidatus Bathyarchaeota archaeon]
MSVSYELLRRRALSFLRDAKGDFEQGDYDLVLFHVEQFIQLYSKYLLYRRIGDYPKTHSIIRLLKDLVRVYDARDLDGFLNENLEALYLLEEAYVSSRYLPREYDMDIASKILKLSEEILEVFKCLELR